MKSQWLMLGLGILIMVVTVSAAIYFLFFYEPVPIERLAREICTCAQTAEVKGSTMKQAKEPFKYASGLEGCFGETFKSYNSPSFSQRDREIYVDQVTDKVMEICPESLSEIFR